MLYSVYHSIVTGTTYAISLLCQIVMDETLEALAIVGNRCPIVPSEAPNSMPGKLSN